MMEAQPGRARTPTIWIFMALTVLAALARAEAPPNLILILSDDHRWDALGIAGNERVHTPVLDAMAREGLYLRQATIHVSQCPPSRATLLTGLPPHTHGFHSGQVQEARARDSARFCGASTLPALLAARGYRTTLVGKWHLAADPWECGFAEIETWIPQGAALFEDPGSLARGKSRKLGKRSGYTQEILTDDVIRVIRESAGKEEPFFIWAAFIAPHLPYGPNPPRIRKLYEGKTVPELLPPSFPKDQETNPNWRLYYEAVSHLDEQVGRILATLDEVGARENTVVLFLGDNGYMMGERGVGLSGPAGKVVPYESSLRVPLLVSGLEGLSGVDDSQVSSLDVAPTLLALAGGAPLASWPGRDFVAALRAGVGPREAFSEWSDEKGSRFGHLAFRAVRTGEHKLIDWLDPKRGDELYDLRADPLEERNLIEVPELAEVLSDLRRRLDRWRRETGDPAVAQE